MNKERCPGSGQPVKNYRNGNALGPKFFGKGLGDCGWCDENVGTRKGTKLANPHKKKEG